MTLLKGPYESLLFAFKVVVKGLSAGNIKVGIFLIMKLKGQDCSLGFSEKKKTGISFHKGSTLMPSSVLKVSF